MDEHRGERAVLTGRINRLRETFGDPKAPDITRKITACVSCRRQKIKCHITHPQQPCERCRKRGLSCTVNRSLQTILEDDAGWKDKLGDKIHRLTASINLLAEHLNLPEAIVAEDDSAGIPSTDADVPMHSMTAERGQLPAVLTASTALSIGGSETSASMASDAGTTSRQEPEFTPASIPAKSIPHVTDQSAAARNGPDAPMPQQERDLVDRGLITLEQAELLFTAFHGSLDHYLYRIVPNVPSLDMARRCSPLLVAAICTVACLHHPDPSLSAVYSRCLQELIRLSASRIFSGRNTMYDVQAFVIGAFWLQDLAWTFAGTAVRMSSELQFHRAILRIGESTGPGDEQDYLEARLYYLVYVCDHQLSIAYGRPPMTGEHEAIRLTARFMKSPFVVEADSRLISQVQIWSITGQLFETFGTDSTQPVDPGAVPQLRRFSLALDAWRADWSDRFRTSKHVGNYPQKGVGLHYYFAKLYLCSHAFRGIAKSHPAAAQPRGRAASDASSSWTTSSSSRVPDEMVEIAESAVSSATHILRAINTDSEWRSYLKELPLYFHTMIAFAAVFLLRISTDCGGGIQVNADQTIRLVHQSFVVLDSVAQDMKPDHVLVRIVSGLSTIIGRCRQQQLSGSNHNWLPQALQNNQRHLGQEEAQEPSPGLSIGSTDFGGRDPGMVGVQSQLPGPGTVWPPPDDMSWIHQLGSGLEFYDLLQPFTGRVPSAVPEPVLMDLGDGVSGTMAMHGTSSLENQALFN